MTEKQLAYIENFEINEGGYFYECIKPISRKLLENCFRTIKEESKDKGGKKIVEIIHQKVPNEAIFFSLLVFSYQNTPTFLSKIESPNLPKETLIGYFVIIEIENYIVLLSRHTPTIKELYQHLKPIQDNKLAGSVLSDDSNFVQLKITNSLQMSDAIRNKSFEGKDLSNSLPRYNVGKSIVKGTKIRDNNQTISISFSTSRLCLLGTKSTIYELCKWCKTIISFIMNPYDISHTILNSYARSIKWSDAPENLTPQYLLIDFFELMNYVESEKLQLVYNDETDFYKPIEFSKLLNKYSDSLKLQGIEENNTKCFYTEKFANQLFVKQSNTSLTIKSKGRINRLFLKKEDGNYENFISYINKKKCYIIGFDDINYSYTNAQLYHDTNIIESLDYMLDIFEENPDFERVTSEKGQIIDNMTKFDETSMFYQIENMFIKDETIKYVICDDLGNEYADHIIIGCNKILYVHSKCDQLKSLSASALQVVIAQAMKNIGNVRYGNISDKVSTWKNKNYSKTAIPVCRKGEIDHLEEAYKNALKSPNSIQEVCLAVNFVSKQELKNALDSIKQQKPFKQRGNVVQLIWLLSGFILACKEADMKCKILCRP